MTDDIITTIRPGFVERALGTDYAIRVYNEDAVRAIEIDVMVDGAPSSRLQLRGAGPTWSAAIEQTKRANITWFDLERPFREVPELIEMLRRQTAEPVVP